MTLEDIYRNNYPIVFGYLLSLGADHHVAEELTAETFLRAIQHAHRYDGNCKPSTWLCTIGKNLYFNERKRQKRRASLDETMYAASDSPEDRYIQTEQAKLVLSVARQLDSPYREVFFL